MAKIKKLQELENYINNELNKEIDYLKSAKNKGEKLVSAGKLMAYENTLIVIKNLKNETNETKNL